jgi:prepilin-type N-terminal cleavage/methylation domain-containing protein
LNRRAFTLMEMLVSIVILVLITLFMYGAIASSKLTGRTLSRHTDMEHNRTKLYELFYRDIIEALTVNPLPTQNRRFTMLELQTRNSLYDIAAPHVLWYVNAQSRALVRLESARKISLPLSYEQKVFVHGDVFASGVDDFNIYAAAINGDSNGSDLNTTNQRHTSSYDLNATRYFDHYLLFLGQKNKEPLLLEIGI